MVNPSPDEAEKSISFLSGSVSRRFSEAGDAALAESFQHSQFQRVPEPDHADAKKQKPGLICRDDEICQAKDGDRFVMIFAQKEPNNAIEGPDKSQPDASRAIAFIGQDRACNDDIQPETARTAFSIMELVCAQSDAYIAGNRRQGLPQGDPRSPGKTTDRHFYLVVPHGKMEAFKKAALEIGNEIETSDSLPKQFSSATRLSLDHINHIAGGTVKPHVEFKRDAPDKPIYLQLRMTNVPKVLAEQLATISDQDFAALADTKRAAMRNAVRIAATGKDITLRCDADYFPKAASAICLYHAREQEKAAGAGWAIGGTQNRPGLPNREQRPRLGNEGGSADQ